MKMDTISLAIIALNASITSYILIRTLLKASLELKGYKKMREEFVDLRENFDTLERRTKKQELILNDTYESVRTGLAKMSQRKNRAEKISADILEQEEPKDQKNQLPLFKMPN